MVCDRTASALSSVTSADSEGEARSSANNRATLDSHSSPRLPLVLALPLPLVLVLTLVLPLPLAMPLRFVRCEKDAKDWGATMLGGVDSAIESERSAAMMLVSMKGDDDDDNDDDGVMISRTRVSILSETDADEDEDDRDDA